MVQKVLLSHRTNHAIVNKNQRAHSTDVSGVMEGKLSTNKIGTNLGRGSSAQQLSTRVSGVVHNGSG